jgi:hypothetical protein
MANINSVDIMALKKGEVNLGVSCYSVYHSSAALLYIRSSSVTAGPRAFGNYDGVLHAGL